MSKQLAGKLVNQYLFNPKNCSKLAMKLDHKSSTYKGCERNRKL